MPNEQFIKACCNGNTLYIHEHINSANVSRSDIIAGIIAVVKTDDFPTMLILFGYDKVTTMDSFYIVMKYCTDMSLKLMLIDIYIMHGEYNQDVYEFGCRYNIMQIVCHMVTRNVNINAGKIIAATCNSVDVIQFLNN